MSTALILPYAQHTRPPRAAFFRKVMVLGNPFANHDISFLSSGFPGPYVDQILDIPYSGLTVGWNEGEEEPQPTRQLFKAD